MGRSGAASHSDEVYVCSAQYFVNSSLAPVLLFRRRLKSVADVLKGIRNRGFTQARWEALLSFWDAVCRHGPCIVTVVDVHPTWRCTSLLGGVPVGSGDGVGNCHDVSNS